MPSSFTLTVNQIIEKALKRLGVFADGEEMTSEMHNSALEDLGLILKGLRRYDKFLPVLEKVTVRVETPSVVTHNDVVYYALLDHTSSATTEPGVSDGWENTWYASSIFETTPAAWATDTDYTSGSEITTDDDVTHIEYATIREDDEDYPVKLIDRFEESGIQSKWETGRPRCLRFDRYANKIQLWYIPDEVYYLTYGAVRMPGDISNPGLTPPDMPVEWLDFLIYALAAKQADEYEVEEAKINRMIGLAQAQLKLNLRDQVEDKDCDQIEPLYC